MAHLDNLPFVEKGLDDIVAKRKTCTARGSPKGKVGDTFPARHTTQEIILVHPLELGKVSMFLYRQEGYNSPAQYIADWREMHKDEKWYDSSVVFVHHFREVRA